MVSNEFDFSLLAVFGARRQHSALVRGMCVCNASDDNNQPKKKNERIAEPDSNDWGPVIEVEPLETNEHVHAVPSQQNAPPMPNIAAVSNTNNIISITLLLILCSVCDEHIADMLMLQNWLWWW